MRFQITNKVNIDYNIEIGLVNRIPQFENNLVSLTNNVNNAQICLDYESERELAHELFYFLARYRETLDV